MAKKISLSEKTNLTLFERILIPSVLSGKEGDYATVIVVMDLKKKVELTQKELTDYNVKFGDKQIAWNLGKKKDEFSFEFTTLEKLELKLALTKMNESKKLTEEFIPLFEKFAK